MKKFNGKLYEKTFPHTEQKTSVFGGRESTRPVRIYLDEMNNVTVLSKVSHNQASDSVAENMTILVALASENQVRRITAFGEENVKMLGSLKRGDVLSIAGKIIPAGLNGGTPGFTAEVFGDIVERNTLPATEEPAGISDQHDHAATSANSNLRSAEAAE